jgi:hypothetical protein
VVVVSRWPFLRLMATLATNLPGSDRAISPLHVYPAVLRQVEQAWNSRMA